MSKLLKFITKSDKDASLRMLAIALFLGLSIWLYPQLEMSHFLATLIIAGTALGLLCWSSIKMQRALRTELINISQAMAPVAASATPNENSASDVQEMAQNIQQQLQQINDKHQALNDASKTLTEQTQDAQRAAEQVAQQLEQQQSETQSVTGQFENLRVVFDTTKASANEAIEISQKTESEGDSGKLVLTEAMSGIMALGDSVNETGAMVETLGKDSEAIGGIVNVIKSVAEQTNLLALNAAIEAARAGEQGRGFAVVADEVRSLANKTQGSAQEIEDLIQQLLRNVESANAAIHGSMKLSEKSDELIEGVVVSYSEIVGHMAEIASVINGISESAQQGQQTTADASQSLEQLETSIDDSRGYLSQFESSSNELASLGKQLATSNE